MAEHDPLTEVCNRRSFYDLAVMELERARKENRPCVLVIFDIDHFKRFNDSYGHLDGDAALRHLTQTVKNELRGPDILGRYGGEEFVLLLPGVDQPTGEAIAERLRLAVATSPVPTKTAGPVTITISMGLVLVPPEGNEERKVSFLERYLGFADNALYAAKESGRNRLMASSCALEHVKL
ncbi:Response regulator PleD (fragment) [uncultured delta proteobacterium]|uniref:Response regulator PleD n=1 Tax=uncultured delta proteobacterium TaxID=34034 RepID=A0A212JV26_9DELT